MAHGKLFSAAAIGISQSYTKNAPAGERISFLALTHANILRFP